METKPPEDARKKRVSAEVAEGATGTTEEKVKKLRAHESASNLAEHVAVEENPKQPERQTESHSSKKSSNQTIDKASKKVWDLESALHHLVRAKGNEKEKLSSNTCVSFRVGHAGDVSALASFYRKSTSEEKQSPNPVSSSSSEDTSLEVLLAEGLGDEDTPPSVFALLADVYKEDRSKVPYLAAAALLTLGWQENARVLRVEWSAIDRESEVADVLERRLWLRLSTLALMTSCQILIVNERTTSRS